MATKLSRIRTDLRADAVKQLGGAYSFDAVDRAYIDEQIRATQEHVEVSLVNGAIATWFSTGVALAKGDVVVSATTSNNARLVALATPSALLAAGGALGVVAREAAANARVLVAIQGLLPRTTTGLAALSGVARVSSAGRVELAAPLVDGDYPIGTIDSAGTLSVAPGSVATTGADVPANAALPVIVATAAALPAYTRVGHVITATANGALTIDGSAVASFVGGRVLVKDGADGSDNGIYDVTAAGSGGSKFVLTRSADQNSSAEVTEGLRVYSRFGDVNYRMVFVLATPGPITLNTTALEFVASFASLSAAHADLAPLATTVDVGGRGAGANLHVAQVTTPTVTADEVATPLVHAPDATDGVTFSAGGEALGTFKFLSGFPVIEANAGQDGLQINALATGQNIAIAAEAEVSLIVDAADGLVFIQSHEIDVYGDASDDDVALHIEPVGLGTTKLQFGVGVTAAEISQPSTTAAAGATMRLVGQRSTHASGVGSRMVLVSGQGTVDGGEWIGGSQSGGTFAGVVKLKVGVTDSDDGSGGADVLVSDPETFNTKLLNPNGGSNFEAHDNYAAITAPLVSFSVDSASSPIAANGWDFPKKSTTSATAETKLVSSVPIPNSRNGVARVTCTAYSAATGEQYIMTGAYHVVQNGGTAVVTAFAAGGEAPATNLTGVDAYLAANSWTVLAAGGSLAISYVNADTGGTHVVITLAAYVTFTMDGH